MVWVRRALVTSSNWVFIKSRVGYPEVGGGITSMFKSEGSRPPVDLRSMFPSGGGGGTVRASSFAREMVANSWDAFWFSDHTHPELELSFRFVRIAGHQARGYRRAAGLELLSGRVSTDGSNGMPTRGDLGLLPGDDCLAAGPSAPLDVLVVEERWGGGMEGCWHEGASALERALIKVGWAQSARGAGGSFGYGKAAVAQGSKVHSVIAYSCFPAADGDRGVTRRLLGATYWRPHQIGAAQYNGFALLGVEDGDTVHPFEDDEADARAQQLGLAVRSIEEPRERGTTFLLIDPSFTPSELRAALQVNWWPALQGTREWRMKLFVAEPSRPEVPVVVDVDHPRLGSFVRTFRAMEGVDDLAGDAREFEIESDGGNPLGGLTLCSADASEGAPRTGLVALMRDPLMVVNYREAGRGDPVVRGVFVADVDVNENLRQTEPAEHDKWLRTAAGDNRGSPDDYRMVGDLLKGIDDAVLDYRSEMQPAAPERFGETPVFSGFLGVPGAATGRGRKRRSNETERRPRRRITVHLVHPETLVEVERPTRIIGDGARSLRATATVAFGIADWVDADRVAVSVELGARIVEDGGQGERLPVTVEAPSGFSPVSAPDGVARFEGHLQRGKSSYFALETSDYDEEWTVDVYFDANEATGGTS
jgi:hypothetical protein